MKLIIPGEPAAKGRPKFTRAGIAYTPKKTVNYETLVKQIYAVEHPGEWIEGPVKVIIAAYFKIPESASKKKKALMEANQLRPTKKPDLSNIVKIIEDALNKVAYSDDSQIVELIAKKYYSICPRVEIEIQSYSLNTPNEGANSL